MTMHLSARQISDMLAGENNPAYQAHLNSCASCSAEFEQLRESLGHFRNSVRNWSGEQMSAASSPRYAPPGLPFPALRGFALIIALTVLVATIALRFSGPFFQRAVEPTAVAPVSDSVLLNQIRLDVSQPVPVPLQTLQPLVVERTQ